MFAKVFTQIFDSSIAEDYRVRLVFEDLLKLADKDGIVDMTQASIARRTNVPIKIVKHGITELEKPDRASRTPDADGRRIVRLDEHRDWGWRIVNFAKYRESATKEMLRMSEAERKKAYRSKFPPRTPCTNKKQSTEAELSRNCPGHVRDIERTHLPEVNGAWEKTPKTQWLRDSLCREFKRPETDFWDYEEESNLATVARRPAVTEEFTALFQYRARNGRFFPQSIKSLLTRWQEILDQARNWKPPKAQNYEHTIKGPFA